MELLFLCTILMALVSYCSMALARPINPLTQGQKIIATNEANIIELHKEQKEKELTLLATA